MATTTTVNIDPGAVIASPLPDVLVRGIGITVDGTASCTKTTSSVGSDGLPVEPTTDAIDSIDKVEVRLGTGGTFK